MRVRHRTPHQTSPLPLLLSSIYFTWYQVIVTFILPSIVMISCYSSVIHSLRRATNNMVVMTNRLGPVISLVRQEQENNDCKIHKM